MGDQPSILCRTRFGKNFLFAACVFWGMNYNFLTKIAGAVSRFGI